MSRDRRSVFTCRCGWTGVYWTFTKRTCPDCERLLHRVSVIEEQRIAKAKRELAQGGKL